METDYKNVWINPTVEEVGDFRNIIGFDMDSVLNYGCSGAIRNAFMNEFGIAEVEIVDTDPIHGHRIFHMNPPEYIDYSNNFIYKLIADVIINDSPSFLTTPFMPAVTEYVYKVTGKPITVITLRKPSTVHVTHDWLAENLTVPFRCYILNGKSKDHLVDRLNLSIFIDDRHKTIKNLLSWCEYPVLYKREWNQNRPIRLPVIEIRDLRDIIPLLNIKLGRVPMEWPEGLPYPKPNGERITKKYATII
jgi:hypothetical protein